MNTPFSTLPGVQSVQTLTHRHLFTNPQGRKAASPNAVIDATKSRDVFNTVDVAVLESGLVMGKITTGGKYRPSIIGVLGTALSAATVTSITVTAAMATEVARLIAVAAGNVSLRLYGPPSAAGTNAATTIAVTAASGTTLTVTSVTIPAYVVGSLLQPMDGAQTPVTFMANEYGLPVTGVDGTSADQQLSPFYNGGDIDVNQILGYSTMDASVQSWLKTQLRANADFTFSDDR